MKNKRRVRFDYIVWGILICLMVTCVFVLLLEGKRDNTIFEFGRIEKSASELQNITYMGNEITLPYKVENAGKAETISISCVLPTKVRANAIMFSSAYCKVEVFVDGVEVYSYGKRETTGLDRAAENVCLIVKLPEESNGKTLTISFTPTITRKTTIPQIYYDDEYALQVMIVQDSIMPAMFCAIYSFIAVTFIWIGISRYRRFREKNRLAIFVNFGLFVLSVSTWMFFDSEIPQVLMAKNSFIIFARHILLATVGIPYLGICKGILSKGHKLLNAIRLYVIVNAIAEILLYAFRIAHLPETIIFTHISVGVMGVVSIFLAFLDWKEIKEQRILLHGLACLIASALLGMVMFYAFPSRKYGSIIFGIGLALFIISLMRLIMMQEYAYFEEHTAMAIYREMAYEDKLTGCGNRAALERLIEELNDGTNVKFIMVDVNRLKKINDNFGHDAGDELIKGASYCLQAAAKDMEKPENVEVFRLGGDEFAILIWGTNCAIDAYYEKLNKHMLEYNENHEHKLSVAKGYAEVIWNRFEYGFAELYRSADQVMYEDKERCHKEEAKQA